MRFPRCGLLLVVACVSPHPVAPPAPAHMAPTLGETWTIDYAETQQAIALLVDTVHITGAPIAVTDEPMPEEHHNTIFAIAALRGIRTLFAVQ